MNNRRDFLLESLSILAAARGRAAPAKPGLRSPELLDLTRLEKFVEPLPIPVRAEPLAGGHGVAIRYRIAMRQFKAQVHPEMKPTTMWGYGGASPGPTVEVKRGQRISVEWVNELPLQHLFPVDHTLHGAEADKPEVRAVVHLHGGRVSPENDGYPERWITAGQTATYEYGNQQDAAMLFYHDHAMGITRLNAAAGLMGLYIVRDAEEQALELPRDEFEIPLVLFDRSFLESGQIFYPVSTNPEAPWVSEYYGGGILVNGKLFPYLNVESRKYRFRLLNASNGSYYVLTFAHGKNFDSAAEVFQVIGGDQGLHAAPQSMEKLLIGPGERSDIVVDFRASTGRKLYLKTKNSLIMELRISDKPVGDQSQVPAALRAVGRLSEGSAVKTRELTLADYQDRLGRSHAMLLNGMHWSMPVTEKPVLGSTEIWSFLNLTDDSHPIHLHLVRFQILDRRPFDLQVYQLTGTLSYLGPAERPSAEERCWKDTVRVDPLTVTRIIVKFEGYAGRYVWHCHMLEHEDNEMMRPYEVVNA